MNTLQLVRVKRAKTRRRLQHPIYWRVTAVVVHDGNVFEIGEIEPEIAIFGHVRHAQCAQPRRRHLLCPYSAIPFLFISANYFVNLGELVCSSRRSFACVSTI